MKMVLVTLSYKNGSFSFPEELCMVTFMVKKRISLSGSSGSGTLCRLPAATAYGLYGIEEFTMDSQ